MGTAAFNLHFLATGRRRIVNSTATTSYRLLCSGLYLIERPSAHIFPTGIPLRLASPLPSPRPQATSASSNEGDEAVQRHFRACQ